MINVTLKTIQRIFLFAILSCCNMLCQCDPSVTTELLVGTVTINDKIPAAAHDMWQLGSNINDVTSLSTNDSCHLLVTGTLLVSMDNEIFWYSGVGRVKIQESDASIACVYMTVTGVEVNHQYVRYLAIIFDSTHSDFPRIFQIH
jgi:hypothetical protein